MNKTERQNAILSRLQNLPELSVAELSADLNVSQVTIRKDLTQLEQEGKLLRSYGKAVLQPFYSAGVSSCFIPPESQNDYRRKQIIGALAADLVNDEDFIFLGPGYTCLEVAKNLRNKKRLTIMTTNISAAIELADIPEFKLRIVPGDFTKRNGTYYVTGQTAASALETCYFDKIIITVDGILEDRGFSVLDEVTAQIFHSVIKEGSQVMICATHAKFGKNALTPLGSLALASTVVSDENLPPEFYEKFRSLHVNMITPDHHIL